MIKDYIKKQLIENYNQAAKAADCDIDNYQPIREWVECEAQSDPGFFRWLFQEEFDNDFDNDLSDEQREAFEEYLNSL